MRQIKSKLSIVMLLIVVLMSMNLHSQNQIVHSNVFVRVFDYEGKKIGKGQVNFVNDSILELRKSGRLFSIPVKEINYIKTKRSDGNSMLLQTVIGFTVGAIIGAATAEPDKSLGGYSAGDGALIGGSVGALMGAGAGGITIAVKNSKLHIIDGDIQNLRAFIEKIE
jgi:hypothetical protein